MHKAKNLNLNNPLGTDLKLLRKDLVQSINQAWNILKNDAERPNPFSGNTYPGHFVHFRADM